MSQKILVFPNKYKNFKFNNNIVKINSFINIQRGENIIVNDLKYRF